MYAIVRHQNGVYETIYWSGMEPITPGIECPETSEVYGYYLSGSEATTDEWKLSRQGYKVIPYVKKKEVKNDNRSLRFWKIRKGFSVFWA